MTTPKWAQFEIDATNHLLERFGQYGHFTRQGAADSSVSDIFVETNAGNSFYIEAKLSPAQSGQFVLTPDMETGQFEYSVHNINALNEYSAAILEYMNSDFEQFSSAGSRGKSILFPEAEDIFAQWIIESYRQKHAEFIITNGFQLVPLEDFANAFNVSAKYRMKRSGTSHVGVRDTPLVMDFIRAEYGVDSFIVGEGKEKGKLWITENIPSFFLGDREFLLSKPQNGAYAIRKRSTTQNSNVIFSVRLNKDYVGMTDNDFAAML